MFPDGLFLEMLTATFKSNKSTSNSVSLFVREDGGDGQVLAGHAAVRSDSAALGPVSEPRVPYLLSASLRRVRLAGWACHTEQLSPSVGCTVWKRQ